MRPRSQSSVKVLERSCIPLRGREPGDDIVAIVERDRQTAFAAVLDGVRGQHGAVLEGCTSGLWAARQVLAALSEQDAAVSAPEAVLAITERLRDAGSLQGPAPAGCVAVVLSVARRELWRVGDCQAALVGEAGLWVWEGGSAIDEVTTRARATYLRCLLAAGTDPAELVERDPGRELIEPLLRAQQALANSEDPAGFGVLNGTDVPARYVEVLPLPETALEVILASDGYPVLGPDLASTEAALAADIERDPLRIGERPGTKAVQPGQDAFDDRSYLRLRLGAAS